MQTGILQEGTVSRANDSGRAVHGIGSAQPKSRGSDQVMKGKGKTMRSKTREMIKIAGISMLAVLTMFMVIEILKVIVVRWY